MSKSILEAMGMAEQEVAPYNGSNDLQVQTVTDEKNIVMEGELQETEISRILDTSTEDKKIKDADSDIDTLIMEGIAAMREVWATAPNMDPRYTNRGMEVGAMIMKTTLEAIAQKQEFSLKEKEFKLKKASTGLPTQISNTNVNTIITADRNTIMDMISKSSPPMVGSMMEKKTTGE